MNTDPIADYLTRVRNAIKANHRVVEIPASNIKKEITKVLYHKGYIQSYRFDDSSVQGTIKIALKYNPTTKVPAITKLERISSPGLRTYAHVENMPRVLSGLGIAILSTSKGVMTEKEDAVMPHKTLREQGFTKPIYQTHGISTMEFVRVGGKDMEGTIFPAGPVGVASLVPDSHPSKAAGLAYIKQYEENN